MASQVEIYNIALIALGADPIVDIGDLTAHARTVDSLYSATRDRVLAAHPWNFALRRVALAATDAPAFEFETAFALPADPFCLRAHRVYELEDSQWRVEGRTLVTSDLADTDACKLVFIARVDDPGLFAPGFADVLGLELAHRACLRVTGNAALKEEIAGDLKKAWREARSQNAQERGRDPEGESSFEAAMR